MQEGKVDSLKNPRGIAASQLIQTINRVGWYCRTTPAITGAKKLHGEAQAALLLTSEFMALL